jgi:hypothetical protein
VRFTPPRDVYPGPIERPVQQLGESALVGVEDMGVDL